MKEKIKWWRKNGAKILVILCIINMSTYDNDMINGILCLLFLTIPCGIKIVNKNKVIWYLRQIIFLILGLSYLNLEKIFSIFVT